jgi:voltage-gated potassium channel
LLEEELDAGKAGAAHEVPLGGEEPTALRRSLDHELLGLAIGLCNPEEVENARHGGVVEEPVTDGAVAADALAAASDPHEGPEGERGAHASIMRAPRKGGNQRSSRFDRPPARTRPAPVEVPVVSIELPGLSPRGERIERLFEWPVLVAALLAIPVVVIDQADVDQPWDTIAAVANWAIWVVFAAELVALMAVTPDRRRWLFAHPVEVAIVVLTPPFLPASLQAVRVLRLARLLPLARLAVNLRRMFSVEGLLYAGLLALLTALAGGEIFAALENTSSWQGIYWCITSMTTLGSDLQPTTTGAHVLAVVVVLVGLAFIALLTGAIARRFQDPVLAGVGEEVESSERGEPDIQHEVHEISSRLKELGDDLDRLSARIRGPS